MYRRLKATKDCYITNKIIRNSFRATDANTGEAASLDLFKLYDESNISGDDTPIELTRILIKFDLDPLRALTSSILDFSSPSFKCELKLHDVYGGQTLPSNFKTIIFPLSQSFDEGVGRDVTKFQDIDAANFLTASISGDSAIAWFLSGANKQGLLGSDDIDIIASGNLSDGNGIVDLWESQTFTNGTEDLSVDITTIVSGVLAGQIPDHGFRISFSGSQETDDKTRFVKRFSSRHNSNTRKRPEIAVKYNDSIQDHHSSFFFNMSGSLFLNNFERGAAANIVSGSSLEKVSGNDSLILKLVTGSYSKSITASQHSVGDLFMTGVYSASFAINTFGTDSVNDSDTIADFATKSGSIEFTTYWNSTDGTVGFHTGSVVIKKPITTGFANTATRYTVNITNIKQSYRPGRTVNLRFVAYDADEKVAAKKFPLYRASEIATNCHYQIRDAYSNDIIIPFDTTNNSTLMSTDSDGMSFDIFTSDFEVGRSYEADVMIKHGESDQIFKSVGGIFRIDP